MRQLLQIQQIPMRIHYSYPLGQFVPRQTAASEPRSEFEITKQRPEMTVHKDPIRIIIDQTASFESMGRYRPVRFSEKIAAEAREAVAGAVAQIGYDARDMFRTNGAAHVDICKRKMGEYALDTITAFIPVAPTINWEGGTPTRVDFTPFSMDFNWNVRPLPEVPYERGRFNMNVAQWNRVEIAYVGPVNSVTIGSHLRRGI